MILGCSVQQKRLFLSHYMHLVPRDKSVRGEAICCNEMTCVQISYYYRTCLRSRTFVPAAVGPGTNRGFYPRSSG